VGDTVDRGTIDFCAPEVLVGNGVKAHPSMDIFSLGRIIHWLTGKNLTFWPDEINECKSDNERNDMIVEFYENIGDVVKSDVDHVPTRNLIIKLVKFNPSERLSIDELIVRLLLTLRCQDGLL